MLDGDTDRRLRGQVPRVTFLNRSPDDPKHQASGTVWLRHQRDRVCKDNMLQLQVALGWGAGKVVSTATGAHLLHAFLPSMFSCPSTI